MISKLLRRNSLAPCADNTKEYFIFIVYAMERVTSKVAPSPRAILSKVMLPPSSTLTQPPVEREAVLLSVTFAFVFSPLCAVVHAEVSFTVEES